MAALCAPEPARSSDGGPYGPYCPVVMVTLVQPRTG